MGRQCSLAVADRTRIRFILPARKFTDIYSTKSFGVTDLSTVYLQYTVKPKRFVLPK